MAFKTVTCKLGDMRKADEWVIYPQSAETPHLVLIQCDKRIARIDLKAGKGFLSDGKHGNAFVSLSPQLGAKVIDVAADVIAAVQAALA